MVKLKTITVKGYSILTKKISNLSKGKKYYVQIRAYKTSNGNYYGVWSTTKKATTKK